MPKLYRLTFGFDEPKQGWSESWYFQRDGANLIDLIDEFDQLAILRATLLGDTAAVTHIRVSQVLDVATGERTPRVSQGRDLLKRSSTTNKLASPHDSLLVRCITADQMHRKDVYLGGPWTKCFDELRHFVSIDDFQTRFNAWAAEIKLRGLGWLASAVDEKAVVDTYTFDPLTGRTTLTLDGPITFTGDPPHRQVRVDFPGGHETLDGVYLVGPTAGGGLNAITIKPRPTHAFDGRKGSLKTYTLNLVTLGPIAQGQPVSRIDIQRQARRARGKALYAEAGRRAALLRF